jgi:glucose dehydrogenase
MPRPYDTSKRHDARAASTLLVIAGNLMQLPGAVLATAGFAQHVPYHALTGVGMILAGSLVAKRKRAGAWILLLVFVATLAWSLRNVGHGGTPLAWRLVGPTILLTMLALLMPVLRGWRARQTLIAFIGLQTGIIGIGLSSAGDGPLARPAAAVGELLAGQANN